MFQELKSFENVDIRVLSFFPEVNFLLIKYQLYSWQSRNNFRKLESM